VTFTAAITEPDSTPTCQYTTNGSTWVAGVISGASSPYTCTATVTGLTGAVTLNIRASSAGGGPTTGTALSRTVDTTAPATTAAPAAGTYGSDQSVTLTPVDAGVGVASTTYCVDTTNVCVPGTNYTGAVAVTGTPGLSVTKYLRYRATDLFGAVETTKSEQYIIDQSCTDLTVGTISVPPSQTVSGSSVDLTALYTVGGTPNFSSYTYTINGGSVTTPWNSSAFGSAGPEVVTFQVTGNDPDCGGSTVVASNTISVNNALGTAAGTASVTSGDEQIGVSAPYSGDLNASNQLKIEWDLEGGAWSGINFGTVTLAHAASPYNYIITPLVNQTAYQVRVTYLDVANGVTGSAVQIFNNVIPTNPLLHNSVSTGSGKWGGLWGVTGGKYGRFTCATCHVKNTTNIKRIKTGVTAPNPVPSDFPGSGQTIAFTTAVDGSSNFGDDSTAPRVNSTMICEACHTYDATQANGVKYHANNQPSNSGHYNKGDCVKCHEHKQGFKASCNGCHGNPPLVSTDLTATLDPANSTGSGTAGKHDLHVNTLAYGCNTCHTGWETNGEMPKGGDINIGFNALGDTVGTYDGRTIASGATYTKPVGTTVNQTGTLTCSAIYCHGSASPEWSDAGTAVCGSCHGTAGAFGDNRDGAPGTDLSGATTGTKVGKHIAHLVESQTQTGDPCALCHQGAAYGTATHLDGTFQAISFAAAAGGSAAFNGGTSTCSNLACHGDAVWDTASSGGCNFCHGYPPTSANNKHASGVAPVNHDSLNITPNHDDCSYCHGFKDSGSSTLAFADVTGLKGSWTPSAAEHKNGAVTMNGDFNTTAGDDASYNAANGGCDSAACHGNDATHRVGAGNTGSGISLADIGPGACSTCHFVGNGFGAPEVTSASSHVSVTRGAAFGDCTDCHSGHSGGVAIPNNATVGINYASHGGINLGGSGTHSSISAKTTEAEICWGCHVADGTVSEWGTNTRAATGNMPYNYGSLSTSNWTAATWTSGTAQFSYKTGTIASTHSVNSVGASGVDAVGNIRCTYCHDVHNTNTDSVNAAPYLRGTWYGNPYKEDGAPQQGTAYTSANAFGRVPRGSASTTQLMGGYWIDQNSGDPTSTWNANQFAGLCEKCHGNNDGNYTAAEIDTLNQFEANGANWVSALNGHANSVRGASHTDTAAARNIFNARGGTQSAYNGLMAYNGYRRPGDGAGGLRGMEVSFHKGPKVVNWSGESEANGVSTNGGTAVIDWDNLRALDLTGNTVNPSFHQFSCSKCHNPHASRLPKLMITNCLDTKHNTWDNGGTIDSNWANRNLSEADMQVGLNSTSTTETREAGGTATIPTVLRGTTVSNWTTAQNCHRLAGNDPSHPDDAAGQGGGWNTVTPW
jgi:predicted CxxxxCH...CXXCH cytochrome family protein